MAINLAPPPLLSPPGHPPKHRFPPDKTFRIVLNGVITFWLVFYLLFSDSLLAPTGVLKGDGFRR